MQEKGEKQFNFSTICIRQMETMKGNLEKIRSLVFAADINRVYVIEDTNVQLVFS